MFNLKLAGKPVRPLRSLLYLAASVLVAGGCSNDGKNLTGVGNGTVPVTLRAMGVGTASGSRSAMPTRALGATFSTPEDTIPVTFTKALLVVDNVKFHLIEGGETDSTGGGTDSTGATENPDARDQAFAMQFESHGGDNDGDDNTDHDEIIRFKGPFVIDLLTQTSDSLDTQMVQPGTYKNTMGHLRPLRADDWNASSFEYLIGGTVYLQGTVDGPGGDSFTYRAKIYHVFIIRGHFVVDAATPATMFLTFDISQWLRGPGGRFLDPRDGENGLLIRNAIIRSLHMGMDRNHNGRSDDEMHGEDS